MAKTKRKKLIEKLDKICREIVYIRDGGCCQRCGKPVIGQNAHCSHVIPRSKGNALRWHPDNHKLLCFHDHINWWHKNPLEAEEWFKKKFPVRYKFLWSHKEDIVKFSESDLEDLLETCKQKLKELKDL